MLNICGNNENGFRVEPYISRGINELSDKDLGICEAACEAIIERFPSTHSNWNFRVSDEREICLSNRVRMFIFDKRQPHIIMKQLNRAHLKPQYRQKFEEIT
jgi:hypothetical protein